MAQGFYDNSDSMDINELASLNDDISNDFIDQLQKKIVQNIEENPENPYKLPNNINDMDDSTLFEEPSQNMGNAEMQNVTPSVKNNSESVSSQSTQDIESIRSGDKTSRSKTSLGVNQDFDDNFIKKYKAKLKNRAKNVPEKTAQIPDNNVEPAPEAQIESLSSGNISEKPLTQDLKEYNNSLDFLDGNIKYSKYVIYIDPENVNFIESLTVKERKNLINGILRQQEDIAITKHRFKLIQTVINHTVVAIITLALSIPLIYYAINTSLEVTINNHRNALSNWQVLYQEKGKVSRR